jgi:hypothetical protein
MRANAYYKSIFTQIPTTLIFNISSNFIVYYFQSSSQSDSQSATKQLGYWFGKAASPTITNLNQILGIVEISNNILQNTPYHDGPIRPILYFNDSWNLNFLTKKYSFRKFRTEFKWQQHSDHHNSSSNQRKNVYEYLLENSEKSPKLLLMCVVENLGIRSDGRYCGSIKQHTIKHSISRWTDSAYIIF